MSFLGFDWIWSLLACLVSTTAGKALCHPPFLLFLIICQYFHVG